ncbi:MAG: iron-sulfur cluster assembly scaffold protein [Candidatus Nanoarchaeia archaeon]|nr:iron-sulfur cluster assembly scaffold protein [Candidatus Nanoarchaeia archaeon]MDD5588417.1 iron-sulfur cluster assembly scaffold protein [Candidatus Nanoarchaeia archaeon]
MEAYNKKVLALFKHPKNMGKIENPDGLGKVGNAICGDILWVYIKVGKNKKGQEIIKDIKVSTTGCIAAITSSSMVTQLAKGKTLEQAEKITKEDVNNALGKLPEIKFHCSILAQDALKKAIQDYRSKKNK